MDIDKLTLPQLVADLKQAAANCPKCEGTRETVFTARGRDNIVNCLECEPHPRCPGAPGSRRETAERDLARFS